MRETKMEFKRVYGGPYALDMALKSADVLALAVTGITALGKWYAFHSDGAGYVAFDGPFAVTPGRGLGFTRDDGTELFMVDDRSMVELTFEVST
jgi:hypothetical protein